MYTFVYIISSRVFMEKNFKYYRNIFLTILASYIGIKLIDNLKEFTPIVELIFDIVSPFLMGSIIAYILNPIIKFIEGKMDIKRIFSLLITYVLALVVVGLTVALIGPIIVSNITELASQIPFYFEKTQSFVITALKDINDVNPSIFLDIEAQIKESLPQIGSIVISSASQLANATVSIFNSTIDILMSIIISFYLLMEKEAVVNLAKRVLFITVKDKYDFIMEFLRTLNSNIGVYVSSKILDSCIVGFISAIALFLIGSKYSLLLGLIMVFCNLIPYFGPMLGMIPAVIINLFYNPMVSVYAIIALLVVQQIEMVIIEPKIVGGQLGLNPLLTLFSISVGGALFGIPGMIMSTPIMGVLKIYISQHIEHKYYKIVNNRNAI